ncbi:MAG: glycosyltransferase [Phycisphaerales bacterium]|nr:glycosyltransferase [Phycisphaerales bacterium]
MISVIIPAHNEELVIARGLRAIVDGAAPDQLEVIVACNGCTDRTAHIAREFGPPVRVLDIPVASKIAALNAADEVATGFPRFYVDADVVLDLRSIRRMAEVLRSGRTLAAWPELRMDLSHASWPVRAFYRVWTSLPYNRLHGTVGTGVYALSAAGRARFGRFPDIIADDGFVRFTFRPEERVTVSGAVSLVSAPRTLAGLIRIKTRSRLGQFQLRSRQLTRETTDAAFARGPAATLLSRPWLWLDAVVYVLVNLWTRRRARGQTESKAITWERDGLR